MERHEVNDRGRARGLGRQPVSSSYARKHVAKRIIELISSLAAKKTPRCLVAALTRPIDGRPPSRAARSDR